MCRQLFLFQTGKYTFLILVFSFTISTESLSQNIGIGTTTPQAKLDILNSFRVGGTLKFMKYDSTSGSLLLNNSNLGIGTLPSSLYMLDVNGQMRLRHAGSTAGIWLNNSINSLLPTAFIGMEDDNHVGFMGYSGNPKFTLNTQTGALRINGFEGIPGQLLQSQGSSSAASWQSIRQIIKSYHLDDFGTVEVITFDEYEFPFSTLDIPVDFSSRLIISVNYKMTNHCPVFGTCDGKGEFYFTRNGIHHRGMYVDIKNVGTGKATGSLANFIVQVGPGTHQLKFFTQKSHYGSVDYQASIEYISVIVVPL